MRQLIKHDNLHANFAQAECRLREQQQIAPAPRFIPPAVRRVERKPKPVDVACSVCGAIVTSDILEMHEVRWMIASLFEWFVT